MRYERDEATGLGSKVLRSELLVSFFPGYLRHSIRLIRFIQIDSFADRLILDSIDSIRFIHSIPPSFQTFKQTINTCTPSGSPGG